MTTASMMRDRYSFTMSEEEQIIDSEACICGYKLREDSDYINSQNKLITIMVCDSCGAIEHWVSCKGLIESERVI